MNYNSHTLVGNIATDIELRHVGDDNKAVAEFRIAVGRMRREEDSDFFTVKVWGRQAETVHEFMSKGKRVLVEGRHQNRKYTTADGDQRYASEIIANTVRFLSPPDNEDDLPI